MRKSNSIYIFFFVAVILIVALFLSAFPRSNRGEVQPNDQQSIALANEEPYELARVINDQSEQLIKHLGYTVSYNPKWLVPNWVAYELNYETNGEQERSNHFKPDPLVNGDPVTTNDYSKSGYDRGHMAPAADMKWSKQAMRESFYMTNICPQLHNLNAGDWRDLEELAREWAQQYGNIYIACGPIVETNYQTIGKKHSIAVPSAFYKVFLRQTLKGWTSIGFIMQNKAGNRPLMTYMHTVDEVEEQTGIDFFYSLPDSIESKVESTYSISDWSLSHR